MRLAAAPAAARPRRPEVVAEIAALEPDLGVLADYGQIVPRPLLELPRLGILNIHPSLLPRHRGATPVNGRDRGGRPAAGVTIIRMDEGLDTGPIVAPQRGRSTGTETAPELEARGGARGAALLGRTLDRLVAGRVRAEPQPARGATMTSAPARGRAARPVAPRRRAGASGPRAAALAGVVGRDQAGRLVVHTASVAPAGRATTAGQPRGATATGLPCDGDGLLVLDEVQLGGRRRATAAGFLRGPAGAARARRSGSAPAPCAAARA